MAADLMIAATTAPSQLAVQATVSVQWTVTNQGDAAATASWTDDVYLSTDDIFGAGDVQLTSLAAASPLAAGASYSRSANIVVPRATVPGNYFLLFRTDRGNQQAEGNEGNNVIARPIAVVAPDLAIATFTAPTAAAVQQTIGVQWSGVNQGAGAAAAAWSDFLYLSADATLDAGDLQLTSRTGAAPLAAGGEYTRAASVPIPRTVAAGDYYLLLYADRNNQQAETDEGNNLFVQSITIRLPDLVVSAADAPAQAAVQQSIQVTWTVANQGDGRAYASWSDSVSLSTDEFLDAGDTQLVALSGQSALVPDGQYSRTANVAIPRATVAGEYFLLFHADRSNQQAESDEANNLSALAISVLTPNLTIAAATAPAGALPGDSLDVSWTVANRGNGAAAASWVDDIYLSTDASYSADDMLLAGFNGEFPLAAGGEYSHSRTVALPDDIAFGDYFLIVRADRSDQQAESDETDNLFALSLRLSPDNTPPAALGADLAVDEDGAVEVDLRTLASDAETTDDDLAFSVGGAVHGVVELLADGRTARFTPDADFYGAASFTYSVTDGGWLSSPPLTTGAVSIRVAVASVNDAPVAGDDAYSVDEGGVLHVSASGLLSNDSDLEGGLLSAMLVTGPSHGVLARGVDGSFIYTPTAGFYGADSFTYSASDGESNSAPATVSIAVHHAALGGSVSLVNGVLLIDGTDGDDLVEVHRLAGGIMTVYASFLPGPDRTISIQRSQVQRIDASLLGGDDAISIDDELSKPTTIDGGAGNDCLTGGRAADLLRGGEGHDRLYGGRGKDILVGGSGNDLLRGERGRDVLIGGDGADELRGLLGSDLLIAGITSFDDDSQNDDEILRQIAAVWTSDLDYLARIAILMGEAAEGNGQSAELAQLINGVTLFDDGDCDRLFGGLRIDWFLLNPETDRARDADKQERKTVVDAVLP